MNQDGKYYNGKSPISRPVRCVIQTDGLDIFDLENQELIETWKKEDIFQDENHNTAMVLGNRSSKGKIELSNLDISKNLGLSEKSLVKNRMHLIIIWPVILIAAVGLIWMSIPFVSKLVAHKIPYDFEANVASKISLDQQFKPCDLTPEEVEAVRVYSAFLYPKNEMEKKMPITYKISNNKMLNAFTFPGGRIVLLDGLIQEAKTPEELLGVMAHEMGHVVHRDSMGFLVRGGILAGLFGLLTGDFHSTFAVSPQILLSTVALTFDLEMERKADEYAAERLGLVNVSTSGMRSFFSRRKSETTIAAPEFMLTHPDYDKRIARIKETYPKENLPENIVSNWPIIKNICK